MSESNIEHVFQNLNLEFIDLKQQINILIKSMMILKKTSKNRRKIILNVINATKDVQVQRS